MENSGNIVKNIIKAVENNDTRRLKKHSIELTIFLLRFEDFPEDIFDSILEIIRRPKFIDMNKPYILLNDVFSDVSFLSRKQKRELRKVLEILYGKTKNPSTCMIILEIIIKLFATKTSLDVLDRLRTTGVKVQRAMLAYGFRYFINETHNSQLKRVARNYLEKMVSDPYKIVRKEANEALGLLNNK